MSTGTTLEARATTPTVLYESKIACVLYQQQ